MGQQGEEDEDEEDKPRYDPFGALVKNCNMLHNIVGPACIFLKEGFSQTLVCNTAQTPAPLFFSTRRDSFSSPHRD